MPVALAAVVVVVEEEDCEVGRGFRRLWMGCGWGID